MVLNYLKLRQVRQTSAIAKVGLLNRGKSWESLSSRAKRTSSAMDGETPTVGSPRQDYRSVVTS